MSEVFFEQLEIPKPDIFLGVGSCPPAQQVGRIMIEFEKVLQDERPDLVIVVGDVNSTLACSLAAAKCSVPVAHVEAGLRSFDRTMPEELNRIVTDTVSDYLFVTEQSGLDNLESEGIDNSRVFFVGNVMIDSLVRSREKAAGNTVLSKLGLLPKEYALVTMHRPVNVDSRESLLLILEMLERITSECRVVFPVHPRTNASFKSHNLSERLNSIAGIKLLEPVGYLEFVSLMENAIAVITDSGGIQEETTYLRVPCLTLRDSTERPITVTQGSNELLPLDREVVGRRIAEIMAGKVRDGIIPPLWDGRAAERIIEILSSISKSSKDVMQPDDTLTANLAK